MSSNSTVGIYNGLPADPNAKARKMFTERENQQDGLAAILTYCQNKVGFRVGSTDTIPFRQVLKDEFPDIIHGRTTLIQFIDRADNQLTLEIPETYTIQVPIDMPYSHWIRVNTRSGTVLRKNMTTIQETFNG
ncbi:MAG: hypothetical protein BYD32DRAFT_458097 [Podila humilis]|nr:MAG: hypothetical protein BYD32DRAFT_458097 [Podila humilis]